jgi:hypothetical protein
MLVSAVENKYVCMYGNNGVVELQSMVEILEENIVDKEILDYFWIVFES